MPNLPSISYTQFIKKIKKAGFILKRQAKGSHEIWLNPESKRFVTVPHHAVKDFKKGTLSSMIKDVGLPLEEFLRL